MVMTVSRMRMPENSISKESARYWENAYLMKLYMRIVAIVNAATGNV